MKPMLSATLDNIDAVKFPALLSPKLDGIRCLIIDGVPHSRNLKYIPNRHIFDTLVDLQLPPLDGELIVGNPKAADCYRTTNSGVMRRDGEPDWAYYVFDIVEGGVFADRLRRAKAAVQAVGHKRLRIVPHIATHDTEKLLSFESQMLIAGYEGIMGRSLTGPYKHGRATMKEGHLWKLKRFVDSEYRVIGIVEQMHNANEATRDALGRTKRTSHKAGKVGKQTMGALKAVDIHSGVQFEVGTGFTDEDRLTIWETWPEAHDTIRKYKSLPIGVKEKPRFPVDLGPRTDL
jgi:DNA ligase-1